MSRYILLIHSDEAAWDAKTAEQKRAVYQAHEPFAARLQESGGAIVGGAELHPSRSGQVIRTGCTPTDGPFAEAVEQIGGFLEVEIDNYDGLVEAARLLTTTGETVEIRRVMTDADRDESLMDG